MNGTVVIGNSEKSRRHARSIVLSKFWRQGFARAFTILMIFTPMLMTKLAMGANLGWTLSIDDGGKSGTMTDGAVVLKVSEIDQQAKTVSVDGCANEPQNLFALDLSREIMRGGEKWYVAKISQGAFTNAVGKMTGIKLSGEKLVTIGSHAFGNSSDTVKYPSENLTTLDAVLPALTTLGNGAFGNLRWISSLRFHAPKLTTVGQVSLAFLGCNVTGKDSADPSTWPKADIYLPKVTKINYAGMRYIDFDGVLRLPSLTSLENEALLDIGFRSVELGNGVKKFGSHSVSRMNRADGGLRRNIVFGSNTVTFTTALSPKRTSYWFRGGPPVFVGTGFVGDKTCPPENYIRFVVDKSASGWDCVVEAARLRPLSADEVSAYRDIYDDASHPIGWVSYEDFGGTKATGRFAVLARGDVSYVVPDLHVCNEPEYVGGIVPSGGVHELMTSSELVQNVSAVESSSAFGQYIPVKYVVEDASFNGWSAPVTNDYDVGGDVSLDFAECSSKRITWLYSCQVPGVQVADSTSGSVSVTPATYEKGTQVSVKAEPDDNCCLVRWDGNVPEEFRYSTEFSLALNEGLYLKPVFVKCWKYDSVGKTLSDGVWILNVEMKNAAERTLTIVGCKVAPEAASELDISKMIHDGTVQWFVGEVADSAFSGKEDSISKLVLGGDKLVTIGKMAFSSGNYNNFNSSIESLSANLPALESIGFKAFYGYRGLLTFKFDAPKLKKVGDYAFYNLGRQSGIYEATFNSPNLAEVGVESMGGTSWQRFYHRFPKLSKVNSKAFYNLYASRYLEVGTESGIDIWGSQAILSIDQLDHVIIGKRNDGDPIDLSADQSLKVTKARAVTCWFKGCPPKIGVKSFITGGQNNYTNCCFTPCIGAVGWDDLKKKASAADRQLNDAEKEWFDLKYPNAPECVGWITFRDFGLDSDERIGYLTKPGNPYKTTTDLIVQTQPASIGGFIPCSPAVGHGRSLIVPRSQFVSTPYGTVDTGRLGRWRFEGYVLEVADHESETGWRKIAEGDESVVKVDYTENGAKRLTWVYEFRPGFIFYVR